MNLLLKATILSLLLISCNSKTTQDVLAINIEKPKSEFTLAGYNYQMVVENTESKTDSLPIVIVLHSMGSTPETYKKRVGNFDIPIRLLYVEAPYKFEEGFTFFQVEPTNYYEQSTEYKHKVITAETDKLAKFIKASIDKYHPRVKPTIIGASQGGDLSYMMAIKYSELISAAFTLLATLDERTKNELMDTKSETPILIFHGVKDSVVSIDEVRQTKKTLKSKKYKVELFEFEPCDHQITEKMKEDYQIEITKILNR